MSKSMRLQVLIEPELFLRFVKLAKENNKNFKTDSELVRYALQTYIKYEEEIKITLLRYDILVKGKNQEMEALKKQNDALQGERTNLYKEIEVLKHQNKMLNERGNKNGNIHKTKSKKKKSR